MNAPAQPNWLDRVVSYFAPAWAARRMRDRMVMAIAASWTGASYTRRSLKDWFVTPASADEDTLFDLETLRARSRDMVRNAPLATGAVNTVVMNVVGTGLSLLPRPDWEALGMTEEQADEWTAQVEREFRVWAESAECDVTRTQNFYGLQSLVFRSALESGDAFVLLPMIESRTNPYALRVQVVEADRVETPAGKKENAGNKIVAGVEMDANGAPVAYHILRNHPGSPEGIKQDFIRVLAFGERTGRRNVLHIFERTRPGQTRGVPYLAPVVEPLKQLDKYTESELMAAVVASLLTVFVKSETGDGFAPPAGDPAAASSNAEIRLGTGTIVDLAPGEDITTVSPNRPNTAFDPFVQSVLRQIGVALGLPFEVLIKHFTASYSAARAALMEAWKFFRLRREFLAQTFCAPVYEAWMEEAVALGRIAAPGFFDDPARRIAYLQADWIGDAPAQIDPTKEVDAAAKRLEIGVSTLAEETMQLTGGVWKDKHREQVKERRMRERDGLVVVKMPGPSNPQQPQPERSTDRETEEREDAAA
jgi:lambda family phage portal protein